MVTLSLPATAVVCLSRALGAGSLGTSSALPQSPSQSQHPANDLSTLAELMPESALPPPDSSRELKYVLLGVGTQNYTCASGDESAVPGTTGAVAKLYDLGTFLSNHRSAQWAIGSVSCLALTLSSLAQPLEHTLQVHGISNLIGHHFFSSGTPVFALDQLPERPYPVAVVSKAGEADAPTPSCSGLQLSQAITWLYLHDAQAASRGGIDTVYRVETAGGSKPPTCKGQPPSFEVDYAAQYWVYGPKASGYCS